MLKQKKDGTWVIDTAKDMDAVVEAIEERETAITEIEETMEKEYDYLTTKKEIEELKSALQRFMVQYDQAQIIRPDYKIVVIRRWRRTWNVDKLKAAVGKGMFLKMTKMTVDSDKIDDLVREGKLDEKTIEGAFESKPEKPYLRWYYGSEDAGETEANALAEAMK